MGLFYSRPEPRPPPCKCNKGRRSVRQKNDVIQTASLLDLVDEPIIADIFKALKFDVTEAKALHDLLHDLIRNQNLTSLFDFLYRICDPDPQPKTLGNQAQQMALRPFIQGIDKPFTVRYPDLGDVTITFSVKVHRISGWLIRKKTCNVKIDNQPVQQAHGCGINTAELLVLLENAETLIRHIEELLKKISPGTKKKWKIPDTIPFGNGCKIAKLIEIYVRQWGLRSSAYECSLHGGGGTERFRFEVDVATRVLNGVRLVRNRQGDYMAVDEKRRSVLARDASPEPVLKCILRAARQKALDTIKLELARLH